VFIDINAEGISDGEPAWVARAYDRLAKSEKGRSDGKSAYVFITNMNHHRHLDDERANGAVLGFGYGIPDFAKVEQLSLPEVYRRKQKHAIAYSIMESFRGYTKLPVTFDGRLGSDASGATSRRIIIGERYIFDDPIGIAEVTSVSAIPAERTKYIAVHAVNGESSILTADMDDEEIHDYNLHGDVIYGELHNNNKRTDTPFELFEWLVRTYSKYPVEGLLKQIEGSPDIEQFRSLPREQLIIAVAERVALTIVSSNNKNKPNES